MDNFFLLCIFDDLIWRSNDFLKLFTRVTVSNAPLAMPSTWEKHLSLHLKQPIVMDNFEWFQGPSWYLLGVLLLLGIFFTEGISPDQNSCRKLVQVSLQCWQSQQICHVQKFSDLYRIMISFHICFRILCFRPCWFLKSMLWWSLLAILWVRKKNSPRDFSCRFFVKSK